MSGALPRPGRGRPEASPRLPDPPPRRAPARALLAAAAILLLVQTPRAVRGSGPICPEERIEEHYCLGLAYYRAGLARWAAEEFLDAAYCDLEGPRARPAMLLAGCSLFRQGELESALDRLAVLSDNDGDELGRFATLLGGVGLLRLGRRPEGRRRLLGLLDSPAPGALGADAAWEIGWSLLQEHRFDVAGQWFAEWPSGLESAKRAASLAGELEATLPLPRRSPRVARWLALIPGLGHLYCGRPADALSALVVNGLFTWGAIEAFRRDLPVTGVVLAAFEIGWFAGNVRGAALAARTYNRARAEELLRRLRARYPDPEQRIRRRLSEDVLELTPGCPPREEP